MNPLTLNDLSANAFRILGLTAAAAQAQIDAAARKMRIWQDPTMIPASANDAAWIGPIPRTQPDIENAVARLADPVTRLHERFWWFCETPPATDGLPRSDPAEITTLHDVALIHLYRALLTGADSKNFNAWQAMIQRFTMLGESDDYLQWLFEVESDGDFEKRASLDEIAEAQRRIPQRLSSAVVGSVSDALADGDFASAANAVKLASTGGADAGPHDGTKELIDRMEDHLAGCCNVLIQKIDVAWKTRRVADLRPACNHAVSRFDKEIQPLILQFIAATSDVNIQNRARMHGVKLLIHISKAYEACFIFKASERTLETAMNLAAFTPLSLTVTNRLEKTREAAAMHRAMNKSFRLKPGGSFRGNSWFGSVPLRALWIISLLASLGRMGCNSAINNIDSTSTPKNVEPYSTQNPPQFGR